MFFWQWEFMQEGVNAGLCTNVIRPRFGMSGSSSGDEDWIKATSYTPGALSP